MKAEPHQEMPNKPFKWGDEIETLLRSHDWSQTPLGAIETWSDDLKTTVQILLTELEPVQSAPEKSQDYALHQANQLNAFRVKLAEALRPITDAAEIQAIAARILGESLGATRVIYIEVVSEGEEVIVRCNYTNGVAPLSGRYRLEDYQRNLTADHQAGRTQVVTDIPNDSNYTDAQKKKYREIDIAAHIDVPLIKKSQFVALLAAQQSTPRQWTETEVKLVEETAEQTWAAAERAYAEAALRESEAKYRTLFESIDEGFCVVEALFDENDTPVDYRILEINPVFEQQTGLQQAVGKTARQLVDDPEDFWIATYGKVALTGEPIRFENRSAPMNRWFDVYACRTGQPEDRKVAIVFKDISDRKQIEAALRESEERSRNILESIAEAFFALDENWQFTYMNQSGEALLNRSPGDLIGKNIWKEYPGLIGNELETVYRSAMRDRVPQALTAFYPDHDRWYEVRTYPAANGIVVYFNNVTTQIQAETTLRESEEQFRNMADNAPVMVWVTDSTGYCTYLSRNWYDFTGQTEETGLGFGWLNAVHPEDSEASKAIFLTANERYEAFQLEYRLRSKDGEYRWAIDAAAPWFGVDGQFKGYIGSVLDISDRKQAEAALQESEELKQRILESSQDCIKVLTLEGRLLYLNAGGFDLLEIDDPASVSNVKWLDFWQDEDRQNAEAAFVAAKAGNAAQLQGCCPTAKGNLRWWDVIVTPIQDASGKVAQLLAISRDVTKQKQAESEREQLLQQEQAAREAAERANRIKDEFLAVLSHELRSPLNPILGWTQLLQTGRFNQARQAEALATIERNAKLQSQLIEDLLDISRIMQGKLTLNPIPTSLAFVISAAVETVRLAAAAKNIEIALDLDAQIAPILGDAARLQQVVWNLLTNAVKFTPQGGQVMVELRQVEQLAQIRVTDTGIGINAQFIPYVFEYFRQEDGSTTRKFGGLGLGLAIVRQIVELHGGTVTVKSSGEHQGATFIVQLPVLNQPTPVLSHSTQPQLNSETLLDNVQILLVDDDTDTREFQIFLLEQYGATVTAAASGLEALQALEQLIPDVIVSDIGMPEMDGYKLMQQIRSRPPAQGGTVPAIALTAYAVEIDQKRALEVGFQTHLTKPLEPERFVGEIVTLLKPKRA
ncbi:hybrid sensor histidine kinase/response regulator [filamentous cyanobacterium CCT1]|nr:hybrid sensor histidine kinase/response regulator [filamentous cyanobacterium CCT1]PSN81633.1 hybrid sensor histidine kinase/response regulator [filamentous cyanobacterium CCP4]